MDPRSVIESLLFEIENRPLIPKACKTTLAGRLDEQDLVRTDTEAAIRDSAVLALAKKVRYALDPTIDYPRHFSGHVKITLDDGKVLEESQPHPRGGFEDPLPPAEIEAKFRANAELALAPEQVDGIVDLVARLEQLSSIGALSDLLNPK